MPPAPLDIAKPDWREVVGAVIPPVLLIFAVLGTILGGIATPTEAASVGAVGALLMTGYRIGIAPRIILLGTVALIALGILAGAFPVRFQRSDLSSGAYVLGIFYAGLAVVGGLSVLLALRAALQKQVVQEAVKSTMTMTSMIFATIIAAGFFSLVFIGLGGEERVAGILAEMPGGANGALVFCMIVIFIMGFFLDFVEISVIVLPLITPSLILLGHDPIWLGVLIAINLQTSFLTPPFGFSLFYLRGVAPDEISTGQIYAGVLPFICLQIVGITLIWLLPDLATWLPKALF